MNKKLRLVPLATAALLALGMSSVSAKTIYYSVDGSNKLKAFDDTKAAEVTQHKADFQKAQNKGWKVIVEDEGAIVDWKTAAAAKQSYSKGLAATYPAKQPVSNGDGTYTEGDGATKTVKAVATLSSVTITANDDVAAKLPKTVEVTYTDDSKGNASINWDASSVGAVDKTKPGEYTVNGTVADVPENLRAISVKVVVTASNVEANKQVITVSMDGGAVNVSGGLDVVDAAKSVVGTIIPGEYQARVFFKAGTTSDDVTATVTYVKNGAEVTEIMQARTAKDGFFANIGAAKTATITIEKEVQAPPVELDVIDKTKSVIGTIIPGEYQARVFFKAGTTSDDVTATVTYVKNGAEVTETMQARTAKDGFFANIGAAKTATIKVSNDTGSQEITVTMQ